MLTDKEKRILKDLVKTERDELYWCIADNDLDDLDIKYTQDRINELDVITQKLEV